MMDSESRSGRNATSDTKRYEAKRSASPSNLAKLDFEKELQIQSEPQGGSDEDEADWDDGGEDLRQDRPRLDETDGRRIKN